MKTIFLFLAGMTLLHGQNASLRGKVLDNTGQSIAFANVLLYDSEGEQLIKAGITNETGVYLLNTILAGSYMVEISSLGYTTHHIPNIVLGDDQELDLGQTVLEPSIEQLDDVTVTATRPVVQVQPDKTIFNIEGTINSFGQDLLSLLRKAPGVSVDNTDNISMQGREGVLVYVDGKRLPLIGQELTNYLQTISSEQINRLEIITNPDVSFDAEGNAGIINIKLKRNEDIGANGSLNTSYSQGRHPRYNIGFNGNFRNKKWNIFGNASFTKNKSFGESRFDNFQNSLLLVETNNFTFNSTTVNYNFGSDYIISENHTVGFMFNGANGENDDQLPSRVGISEQSSPMQIDSVLQVNGSSIRSNDRQTYNLNYLFENKDEVRLNLDFDYGRYSNNTKRIQPNIYTDGTGNLLSEETILIDAPTDIDIYTTKIDYAGRLFSGNIKMGTKFSSIKTDNSYLFFDEINGSPIRNDNRSRLFVYTENVFAGYLNYAQTLGDKFDINLGLRVEHTDAMGNLDAFIPELNEASVELDYLNWFPNFGITWKPSTKNEFTFGFGRRINRPNYFVLNPFIDQINDLSFERGNPFLRPEISSTLELGFSRGSKFNVRLGYGRTTDKIVRLVEPDANDPRITFSTWENLAEQTSLRLNASWSHSFRNWLSSSLTISSAYIDNQADFDDEAIVNVQIFTYRINIQNTFKVSEKLKVELSGNYNGPAIFGAVFEMEPNGRLDLGLNYKANERLNMGLSVSDLLYTTRFRGFADFNGLSYFGTVQRDSRRIAVSLTYSFGSKDIKERDRRQGLENEQKRVN